MIDSISRQVKAKFLGLDDCKVSGTTCYLMEAAALVMLLIIPLMLRLPDAILAFADPLYVDMIIAFFKD